jgi:hypothetical protein
MKRACIILLALLLVLAACEKQPCKFNVDCSSGQTCVAGTCSAPAVDGQELSDPVYSSECQKRIDGLKDFGKQTYVDFQKKLNSEIPEQEKADVIKPALAEFEKLRACIKCPAFTEEVWTPCNGNAVLDDLISRLKAEVVNLEIGGTMDPKQYQAFMQRINSFVDKGLGCRLQCLKKSVVDTDFDTSDSLPFRPGRAKDCDTLKDALQSQSDSSPAIMWPTYNEISRLGGQEKRTLKDFEFLNVLQAEVEYAQRCYECPKGQIATWKPCDARKVLAQLSIGLSDASGQLGAIIGKLPIERINSINFPINNLFKELRKCKKTCVRDDTVPAPQTDFTKGSNCAQLKELIKGDVFLKQMSDALNALRADKPEGVRMKADVLSVLSNLENCYPCPNGLVRTFSSPCRGIPEATREIASLFKNLAPKPTIRIAYEDLQKCQQKCVTKDRAAADSAASDRDRMKGASDLPRGTGRDDASREPVRGKVLDGISTAIIGVGDGPLLGSALPDPIQLKSLDNCNDMIGRLYSTRDSPDIATIVDHTIFTATESDKATLKKLGEGMSGLAKIIGTSFEKCFKCTPPKKSVFSPCNPQEAVLKVADFVDSLSNPIASGSKIDSASIKKSLTSLLDEVRKCKHSCQGGAETEKLRDRPEVGSAPVQRTELGPRAPAETKFVCSGENFQVVSTTSTILNKGVCPSPLRCVTGSGCEPNPPDRKLNCPINAPVDGADLIRDLNAGEISFLRDAVVRGALGAIGLKSGVFQLRAEGTGALKLDPRIQLFVNEKDVVAVKGTATPIGAVRLNLNALDISLKDYASRCESGKITSSEFAATVAQGVSITPVFTLSTAGQQISTAIDSSINVVRKNLITNSLQVVPLAENVQQKAPVSVLARGGKLATIANKFITAPIQAIKQPINLIVENVLGVQKRNIPEQCTQGNGAACVGLASVVE